MTGQANDLAMHQNELNMWLWRVIECYARNCHRSSSNSVPCKLEWGIIYAAEDEMRPVGNRGRAVWATLCKTRSGSLWLRDFPVSNGHRFLPVISESEVYHWIRHQLYHLGRFCFLMLCSTLVSPKKTFPVNLVQRRYCQQGHVEPRMLNADKGRSNANPKTLGECRYCILIR